MLRHSTSELLLHRATFGTTSAPNLPPAPTPAPPAPRVSSRGHRHRLLLILLLVLRPEDPIYDEKAMALALQHTINSAILNTEAIPTQNSLMLTRTFATSLDHFKK
eukprot:1160167-Pelagomonas_calceolata.AAC.12